MSPFWLGVLSTILAEVVFLVAFFVYYHWYMLHTNRQFEQVLASMQTQEEAKL